jgi:hypothetical protein
MLATDHHDQRARDPRGEARNRKKHRHTYRSQYNSLDTRIRDLFNRVPRLLEEIVSRHIDAQQATPLIGDDHQAHSNLESGQDRVGDEICQEAQPHDTRN